MESNHHYFPDSLLNLCSYSLILHVVQICMLYVLIFIFLCVLFCKYNLCWKLQYGAMAEATPSWFLHHFMFQQSYVYWSHRFRPSELRYLVIGSLCTSNLLVGLQLDELISSTLSPVFSFVYMFSKFNVRGFPWNWRSWTVAIQILFVWGELLKCPLPLKKERITIPSCPPFRYWHLQDSPVLCTTVVLVIFAMRVKKRKA